ncbi:MAG: hypothetical protein LZF60_270107 [Nitrospira sp.]|nr:MAG: hypothetical protein LZF60_270107 [Nitrospira sp.]
MVWLSVAQANDIPLSSPIPPTVHEIELTYAGKGPDPTVAFSGPAPAAGLLPYRPFVPILELRPGLGATQVFGPCLGHAVRSDSSLELEWTADQATRCGQRIELRPGGRPVDLMSYQMLRLRGRATGQVVVAIEDVAGHEREHNHPLTTVTGTFDLSIPLKEIGRGVDLRYVTALVVSSEGHSGQIQLEQLRVTQREAGKTRPAGTGFWVWNYRAAIQESQTLLDTCRKQACSRMLIQMPSLNDDEAIWRDYGRLLGLVQEAGIDALALDGYPEAIQEPHLLADKVQRLLQLVRPGALSGIQLDIEPYLLPGFLDDDAQLRRYLGTIETVHEAIHGRARLSMVIPFWLATPTVGGRPLAYAVMDRADEVAVMSYRTDLDEVQDIAEDILRYGDVIEKPVWLAIETTLLPLEQHVVLRRDLRPDRADAFLDREHRRLRWKPISEPDAPTGAGEWFRIHRRFAVRPERLTFAGRSRVEVSKAISQMLDRTLHPSFAGVMIHDLDGFRALPE